MSAFRFCSVHVVHTVISMMGHQLAQLSNSVETINLYFVPFFHSLTFLCSVMKQPIYSQLKDPMNDQKGLFRMQGNLESPLSAKLCPLQDKGTSQCSSSILPCPVLDMATYTGNLSTLSRISTMFKQITDRPFH